MIEDKQGNVVESIKHYGKELLGFIRKRVNSDADAEDILQDVWYRFSAVVNSQPIEQTGAWLYRVARNRIVDKYRKKSEVSWESDFSEDEEGWALGDVSFASDVTPESIYEEKFIWEQLFKALDELPPEQRTVFIWHELDNIPFVEISELTGEPVGRLISRKRYAVLHLRKRLKVLYSEIVNK